MPHFSGLGGRRGLRISTQNNAIREESYGDQNFSNIVPKHWVGRGIHDVKADTNSISLRFNRRFGLPTVQKPIKMFY